MHKLDNRFRILKQTATFTISYSVRYKYARPKRL